ncbi:hypothetical protein F4X33_20710 [Candidatus Poribacteria bacterium]|nr:hypothetical protein [Candidatus Poribacteria bacterium]
MSRGKTGTRRNEPPFLRYSFNKAQENYKNVKESSSLKRLWIFLFISAQMFTISCSSDLPVKPAGKATQAITCNGLRSYSLLDVELVFINEFSDKHVSLIQDAVAKWQTILYANYELGTQQIPFFNYHETTWQSYGGHDITLEYATTIDDIRIYIESVPIEGTFAGVTAVDWVYRSSQLPLVSTISLDTDLLNEDDRYFRNVVLHELGHAFGFGAPFLGKHLDIWGCSQGSLEGRAFLGTHAAITFDLMGGRDFRYSKVPTSNDWLHWSEAVLGDEAMTTTMRDNDNLPISALTVAAMADLGYVVSLSAYDDYTMPPLADSLTVHFVPDSTEAAGKLNVEGHSFCKFVNKEPRQIGTR